MGLSDWCVPQENVRDPPSKDLTLSFDLSQYVLAHVCPYLHTLMYMHARTCRRIYTNRQREYDLKNKGSCLPLLYDTLELMKHGNIQEFEGPWRHRSS